MALTIPEALKKVQNAMTRGMLKSVVTTSELGAMISIENVSGIGLKLDREGLLPTTEFIDDTGVSTEESTGSDDIPVVQFRRIVGNLDIDGLAEAATPENRNRQIGKKAKATWRLMKDKLINGGHTTGHTLSDTGAPFTALSAFSYGPHLDSARRGPGSIKYELTGDKWSFRAPGEAAYGPTVASTAGTITLKGFNESNFITVTDSGAAAADGETLIYFTSTTNEFDGLWELAHPSMVTGVAGGNGDAFDFGLLDALIDVQKVRENRAFIMNGKLINKYFEEQRALGGTDPVHVAIPGYNAQVPTYRGIPCLTEDNITSYTVGSGTVSDIALVSLNPDEGLVLGAQSVGGEVGALSPDADPRVRSVFGFRVERLGPLEGKDADRTRVKWYGAPALKSWQALAVKQGVVQT